MTKSLEPVMEAIVLPWGCGWRSHAHVLGVRDGPPPLTGLDWFIFTSQAPFETAITLWTLFVTLFLFFFATTW